MRFFKTLIPIVLTLGALSLPATPSTAAPPVPALVEEGAITDNDTHKFPTAVTYGGRVHVAWATNGQANFGERGETAGGGFSREKLGSIGANSSYFNAVVAVANNGTLHFVWIDGGVSGRPATILHRSKAPGQAWSAQHAVAQFEAFANGLAVTVKGNNEVFVIWRHDGDDPNGYIRFAYSSDAGVTWPARNDLPLPAGTYAGSLDIATIPNGPVMATWTGTDGNIYVGEWTGSNFQPTNVTGPRYGARNDFFNPTVTMSPSGQPFIAWRSVGRGVFYGSRQSNGTWGLSNAFQHSDVAGRVAVAVDSRSNVHLAWVSKQSGNWETYYTVKTPTEEFAAPIIVSRDGGAFKANVELTVSNKPGYALGHVFWESFGGGQFIRYARVQTNGIGCLSTAAADVEASAAQNYKLYLPLVARTSETPPPTCY